MDIRPAQAIDFDAIAAITNHYITTSAIHFAYDAVRPEDLAATWRAHPTHPWLVGEEAGAIVGYAKAGVWRERAAYQWTCEVGLYVENGARGGGRGTALYRALLERCAAAGFHSAVAGITLPNAASVALHERLGFRHVGTFEDAGFKHGAWHAVTFYQKQFTAG